MTNPRPMSPEPTTGTRYDSYLMPRSKTPAKDALYLFLAASGWRFDAATTTWHTPEAAPAHAFGRLEHDPEFRWATIQPPSRHDPVLGAVRPAPILKAATNSRGEWFLQGIPEEGSR